ncbi:MAG: 5-formyltetrahydrofolate cyclo-ligase [Dethiobacter sp.]|jgi:5-formyltetrahydrofolate cyclo-ligase|nr:5-formyltetrahydrofolate cyclo-ligase [Dethiobacter sp.]
MTDKKLIRKEVLTRRDLLSWDEVRAHSRQIALQLYSLPEFVQAATVMFFLNFNKEVQTLEMVPAALACGKRVVAPKTVHRERRMILSEILNIDEDVAPGLWGIPEPKPDKIRPVDVSDIDFVLVPGVAFDEKGNRLGYGGGYYDRFFEELRACVPLVAATFELQILPGIPVASWDRRVDIVITEKRIIDCRR